MSRLTRALGGGEKTLLGGIGKSDGYGIEDASTKMIGVLGIAKLSNSY